MQYCLELTSPDTDCYAPARFHVYADGGDKGVYVCGRAAHLARAIKSRAEMLARILDGAVHVKPVQNS